MEWWNVYKLFTYSFEKDPISKNKQQLTGAGVKQADTVPDIRQDGSFGGDGRSIIRLYDTNEFVDLTSISNRLSRYTEYERLRRIPEIETAITIMAQESCQKDSKGNVCTIKCKNEEIKEELENFLFNKSRININRRLLGEIKNAYIRGDAFWELLIDQNNPKSGIHGFVSLPPDSMYRIETTKGRLVEFQQSKEGPDYDALKRGPVDASGVSELVQAKAIRFAPNQIIHIRIGEERKDFYPYGQSLIEPARGPAHQLRMMEDSMVVYRLTRAPERLVFYIDTGKLPPNKAAAFTERMKDSIKKKKVSQKRSTGANSVDERFQPPSVDESYWIPIRPGTQTKIESLPGAQNLGEIDDTVYFRDKLYIALQFPRNYLRSDDIAVTRMTASQMDVKFAIFIETLQSFIEDGIEELCKRHLHLLGYLEEDYEDVSIKITPSSEYREFARAEIVTSRINNATSLKQSGLYSDYDLLTRYMMHNEDEAKEILSRAMLQKLQDLKLQIISQDPSLAGIGVPGNANEKEIGTTPLGPNDQISPPEAEKPEDSLEKSEEKPEESPNQDQEGIDTEHKHKSVPLPDPSPEDIKKYNMEIRSYGYESDKEEIDYSSLEK